MQKKRRDYGDKKTQKQKTTNSNNKQQQHKTCLTHTPVSLTYQCLMNNCHLAQSLLSTATITLKALDIHNLTQTHILTNP